MNFKCNINVKAMTSGEHKKSCASNLLVSSIQYACTIIFIKIFFTIQKDLSKLVIIKIKNIGNNTTDCIQEGHTFLQIFWIIKKVMRCSFIIFTTIAYRIKSVLKTVLRSVFTKVT